jgi:putative nucleotidyltransferase with HDIG domain
MINLEKAKKEFENYTSKFDLNEQSIKRKVSHTFRVEKQCESIANSLKLNNEEVKLAKLIGILHDIARFEQYTQYKTFVDSKSFDHGEYGLKILENNNYIRKYIETDKYDILIKKAVNNHNKYKLEEGLNDKEKLFCNIIRDADKLDIMYQATFETMLYDKEIIEKQVVTKAVFDQFVDNKEIKNDIMQAQIDKLIRTLAFIYDINFRQSYIIIKENNLIDKIIDRFDFKNKETIEQMENIRKTANKFINKKLKEEKDA